MKHRDDGDFESMILTVGAAVVFAAVISVAAWVLGL